MNDLLDNEFHSLYCLTMEPHAANLRNRLHAATAQALLDAAEKAMLKHGFDKVTMQQIAAETGCAPGTFYLYFKNKQDLFEAIVSRHMKALFDASKAAMGGSENPSEKIRLAIAAVFRFYEQNPLFFQVGLVALPMRDRALRAKLREMGHTEDDEMSQYTIEQLRLAQQKALVRTDIPAEMLNSLIHAVVFNFIEVFADLDPPVSVEEKTRIVWGLITGGITKEA